MREWQWEPLDRQLGDLLAKGESGDAALLRQTVRLLSHQVRNGDTCIRLEDFAGESFDDGLPLPDVATWVKQLSGMKSVALESAAKPLILDNEGHLYFHRYWKYEQALAQNLLRLARQRPAHPDDSWLTGQLTNLPLVEQQWIAVTRAFSHGLCVISGGPGTGKTTTVSALMGLLKRWQPDLKISMAAPTGKAAARMQESVRSTVPVLGLDAAEQAALPEETMTLHRLLGYRHGKVSFRHNADNPLAADVVIVDEAAMIDLALMSKLLDAVRPDARLVLLGDKDQLASVETGAVMGALCSEAEDNALTGNLVLLKQVHRFDDDKGIGQLAQTVNRGDADAALDLLHSNRFPDIALLDPQDTSWQKLLREKLLKRMLESSLESAQQIQVLCAHRQGQRGVIGLNQWVENGLISRRSRWYAGRPVMVTRNHYGLKLYNGDLGVTVMDDSGRLRVQFPGHEGIRDLSPARLPSHETAWALTVHKSQGSEFNEVILILPEEASPVLTRELVYTAITRAKSAVRIIGHETVLREALSRSVRRRSGLDEKLKIAKHG